MADEKVAVLIQLRDKMSAPLKKVGGALQGFKKHWLAITAAAAITVMALKKVTEAIVSMTKSLIKANDTVEQFKVRLEVLLGSAEEGNKVFSDMTELASKVPKTYEEIMRSATDLSAVVRGGSAEIAQLMPIVVDLSAGTGMAVQEVVGQIIRMYSAGAAAADMFRERGVSAALGFQAGVSTNAEETMKILIAQWEDGTGKFVGAATALAETFTGLTSMMEDAWFQIKVAIGEEIFAAVKLDMKVILETFNTLQTQGDTYEKVVKNIGNAFATLYENAKNSVGTIIIGFGQGIDIFNDLQVGLAKVNNFIQMAAIGFQKAAIAKGKFLFQDTSVLEAALEDMQLKLQEGIQNELDLRDQANVDYSEKFMVHFNDFKAMLDEKKAALIDNEGAAKQLRDKVSKDNEKRQKFDAKVQKKFAQERLDQLKSLLAGAAAENKTAAVALQAVRIGEAVMNTSAGVTWALASYPPPISYVWAAITAAMGAAEIAMISSAKFAQGTDNVPAMLSSGEMVVPRGFADAIRRGDLTLGGKGGGGGQVISIEINNPILTADNVVGEITEKIAQEISFIFDKEVRD